MRGSIRIGKVAGIPVTMHWSLLLIALLITVNLSSVFGLSFLVATLIAALFFASVVAHETAHALVARRFGVPTESIDLWILGGMARLSKEAPSPKAEFLMAGAGPTTNLVLGGGFTALAAASGHEAIAWLGGINLLLGGLNLLPAAPLDGGRMLQAVLWWRNHDRRRSGVIAAKAGILLGYAVIGFGLVQMAVGQSGLWSIILGWFISNSARQEELTHRTLGALDGLRVGQVMAPVEPTVADYRTIDDAIADLGREHDVVGVKNFNGEVEGIVSLRQLARLPERLRASMRIKEVYVPVEKLGNAVAAEEVGNVLSRMQSSVPAVAVWGPCSRLLGFVTGEALTPRLRNSKQ
ncbi:MAG: site-2 protease family protein [Acidimicrobiia bacterium]